MNIKQIFLPLLGALALIGCNKEAAEPTSSNTTLDQPVTLALSLEGTADANGMRAVSFDANQNVPPTTHDQYSDWTTHCFLRNADGSKKAYAVINWDARVEGGKVKLKMIGHELNLLPIGSTGAELAPENKPVAGERWSIVGITGGGKLNDDRTRVDFAPDADLDNNLQPHQARVPFTFEKAYFTVSAASGERAPQISVHFEPQGSLLNVRVNNKTAQSVQTELRVVSNALSNNGYYDYSTGEGHWTFVQADAQPEILSRSIALDANAGKHYLLWGMPRTASATGFSSKVALGGYKLLAEGSASEQPKERTEGFSNAIAYPMGVDISQSMSSLNILSTIGAPKYTVKVMDAKTNSLIDPLAFTTAAEAYNSGIYYTYADAVKYFGPDSESNTSSYYLPTIWELGTIFPSQKLDAQNALGHNYKYSGEAPADGTPIIERVQFSKDTEPVEVTSEYRGSGGTTTVLYALRLSNYDNNSKRTAFRYEYTQLGEVGGNPFYGMKVTSRYLGNYGDITNYYTEEYWSNPSKNASDRTVTFAALGHSSQNLGKFGYYLSSTHTPFPKSSVGVIRTVALYSLDVSTFMPSGVGVVMPLILFKR